MAEYFVKILGDLLWQEQVDTSLTALPSPEYFKNKILIKAKKVKLTATGSIDTNDDMTEIPNVTAIRGSVHLEKTNF